MTTRTGHRTGAQRRQAQAPASEVRAAIYLRISLDRKGDELGVDRQERLCRKLARERGWAIADVYRDNDKSAYDLTVTRLEYERMIADIRSGKVNAIVAYHGDRIHRRLIKLAELIGILDDHGTQVAYVTTGVMDLASPAGRLMALQWGLLAEFESAIKSERQTAKMQELAEAGKWHGGNRPYGYEADGITVIEAEAQEVAQWAADVIAGKALRQIAREAEARGALSPNGKPFRFDTIKNILKAPRIAGLRQHQGEVIGDALWDALIDEETWQAIKRILEHPDRRHSKHSEYLLTGLLYSPQHPDGSCSPDGYCLHPAEKLRGGKKWETQLRRYNAKGISIIADVADTVISDAALDYADEAHIKPATPKAATAARAEIKRLQGEISELQSAQRARQITASQLIGALAPLNADLEQAEQVLASELASSHEGQGWLNRPGALRKLWDTEAFTADRKREALSELLEFVVVMPQRGPKFQPSRLRYKWRGQAEAASTPKAA